MLSSIFNINLMKRNISARLKALFLLIIFYLNMIIAVGCNLGMCMCCKPGDEGKTSMITNKGVCHLHHNKPAIPLKSGGCTDNCCTENAIKFLSVDKSFPQCFSVSNATVSAILISYAGDLDILDTLVLSSGTRRFVRSHHPPIPDIRIAIQSFQI